MFYHNDGISAVRQPPEYLHQLVDICKVQTCRRFIQNIDRLSRAALRELRRQLDALCLAAGELRAGLSETNIGEAHIIESLNLPRYGWNVLKKLQRLLDCHIQNIIDGLPLITHLQCLTVVALTVTHLAGHIYIRQEVHLDLHNAVAGAGLTAPALHIKAEPPLLVPPRLGVGRSRKEIAYHVEHPGVGRRIGARRPADRRLINGDHLIQCLCSLNRPELSGNLMRPVQLLREVLVQYLIHERGLP